MIVLFGLFFLGVFFAFLGLCYLAIKLWGKS